MPTSNISLTPLPGSSQLHAVGYDAATRTLAAEFVSSKDRHTYHYLDVPPEVATGLMEAESKGSFFYQHVKPRFGFERLDKTETQEGSDA